MDADKEANTLVMILTGMASSVLANIHTPSRPARSSTTNSTGCSRHHPSAANHEALARAHSDTSHAPPE
jgi:hypothetical protein